MIIGDTVKVINRNCKSYGKEGKVKKISLGTVYVLFDDYIGNSIYKTLTFKKGSLIVTKVYQKEDDYKEYVPNTSDESPLTQLGKELARIKKHVEENPIDYQSARSFKDRVLKLFNDFRFVSEAFDLHTKYFADYCKMVRGTGISTDKVWEQIMDVQLNTPIYKESTPSEDYSESKEEYCITVLSSNNEVVNCFVGDKEDIMQKAGRLIVERQIKNCKSKVLFTTPPKEVNVTVTKDGKFNIEREVNDA